LVVRGYLGVNTQAVTEELGRAFGFLDRKGALVSSVSPGQPADKAGLRPGDFITRLDGVEVEDVRWFQTEVAGRRPGTTIQVGYWRQGQEMGTSAVLGEWPVAGTAPQPEPEIRNWLGLAVVDIPLADRQKYGLQFGLVVQSVERGSAAEAAGIVKTDIILEVDQTPLAGPADYEAVKQRMELSGRPVLLRVLRGRETFYTAAGRGGE
jgi:serine protease Do